MTTHQFLTSAWDWNPWVIAVCVLALAGYALLSRFRFSARSGYFLAALVIFFLTLTSPLDVLARHYLFSAHMLQHLLLQLVVPPLVVLSLPPSLPSKPPQHGWFKPVAALLKRPLVTWWLGLGAMWIWHVPAFCSASVTNPWVHRLQSVSLLLMGAAFWWPIIGPWLKHRLTPLLGVLYLFSACVGCTILGIILTFAPLGVCPVFLHPADPVGVLALVQDGWGLTPVKDQQLGGLLMWVPPCFVYLCGIFGLFARWYAGPDPELQEAAPTAAKIRPDLQQPGPLPQEQ